MSCVARAPVPSVDVGKDGDDLPISSKNAAVVDVVGAENYVHVVGGSTLFCAIASFEYEGLTFRDALSLAFAKDSSGVFDISDFPLYRFRSHLHYALAFFV